MIYVLRYVLILLYSAFWALLACAVGLVDRRSDAHWWIARQWVRWILWSCRVEVVADGLENVDPERPCIFMSNHQSVFDIVAIVHSVPVSLRFVAKRELTWIPFFGWALRTGGHVIVDRRDRAGSIRSLARAARRIQEGLNVVVFPEGTRSPSGVLGPFKSGGFYLALGAQVPVVPVTVSGSLRIARKGSLRIESGRIGVRYGRPIPTRALTRDDRDLLKQRVREAILTGHDPELQKPTPCDNLPASRG